MSEFFTPSPRNTPSTPSSWGSVRWVDPPKTPSRRDLFDQFGASITPLMSYRTNSAFKRRLQQDRERRNLLPPLDPELDRLFYASTGSVASTNNESKTNESTRPPRSAPASARMAVFTPQLVRISDNVNDVSSSASSPASSVSLFSSSVSSVSSDSLSPTQVVDWNLSPTQILDDENHLNVDSSKKRAVSEDDESTQPNLKSGKLKWGRKKTGKTSKSSRKIKAPRKSKNKVPRKSKGKSQRRSKGKVPRKSKGRVPRKIKKSTQRKSVK